MTTLLDLGAVSVAAYRLRTGDQTTEASAVTAALVEAEGLLEEELRRHLAWAVRRSPFRIYPDGRVYPDAWPITDGDALTVDGRALVGAMPDPGPFVGVGIDWTWQRATVDWTGGYDDGTNSTRLPLTLAHALYDLASAMANTSLVSVASGATSVSVGDVSVTYGSEGSGAVDGLVPGLSERVCQYRNRWV